MNIYTKTGDDGTTGLAGGTRVLKSDIRIEAYGTVDELIAFTAYLADYRKTSRHDKYILTIIIERLMACSALLACENEECLTKMPQISADDIIVLEKEIDQTEKKLRPLTAFILPLGHEQIDRCHMARTVCRRAERTVVTLNQHTHNYVMVIKYLNRLSDYFFVLARKIGKERGVKEILWNQWKI